MLLFMLMLICLHVCLPGFTNDISTVLPMLLFMLVLMLLVKTRYEGFQSFFLLGSNFQCYSITFRIGTHIGAVGLGDDGSWN